MGLPRIETALFSVMTVALLAVVCFGAYKYKSGGEIKLNKEEWSCVETNKRMIQQTVFSGKVIIQVPVIHSVCVLYRRKD